MTLAPWQDIRDEWDTYDKLLWIISVVKDVTHVTFYCTLLTAGSHERWHTAAPSGRTYCAIRSVFQLWWISIRHTAHVQPHTPAAPGVTSVSQTIRSLMQHTSKKCVYVAAQMSGHDASNDSLVRDEVQMLISIQMWQICAFRGECAHFHADLLQYITFKILLRFTFCFHSSATAEWLKWF